MYKFIFPALAGVCLGMSRPAFASGDDLNDLRNQLETLKRSYETQLRTLEERLQHAEQQAEQNRADLADVAQATPTPGGSAQERINAFNPALSFIMQGSVNSYSEAPDSYALPGFQLGGEAGLAQQGLTLDESEITLSANVDQLFYAQSTLAVHDDREGSGIGIEEAYVDPLALPAGFGARFGRFYSGIGYLNPVHTHAWDFHDEPLAYRAFLGKQYADDGLRVTWTAPTDLYLMVGPKPWPATVFLPASRKVSKAMCKR